MENLLAHTTNSYEILNVLLYPNLVTQYGISSYPSLWRGDSGNTSKISWAKNPTNDMIERAFLTRGFILATLWSSNAA